MNMMRMKISKHVLAAFEFEIFAADFHGDDFLVAQGRRKAAAPQPALLPDDAVLLANNQKNSDNETVPFHGAHLVNKA
jgi:hypothetical protein